MRWLARLGLPARDLRLVVLVASAITAAIVVLAVVSLSSPKHTNAWRLDDTPELERTIEPNALLFEEKSNATKHGSSSE